MATRNGAPAGWILGRGLTRPILAYLVTVIGGTLALASVVLREGGNPTGGSIVVAVALLAFIGIPAMVLTTELVGRLGAASRIRRAVISAAAWVAWGLFIAVALAAFSRLVLVPGVIAVDLVVVGAAGAVFSLLAFGGREARAGLAMILLALAVAVLVGLGSAWMAGRWGGPV